MGTGTKQEGHSEVANGNLGSERTVRIGANTVATLTRRRAEVLFYDIGKLSRTEIP
jgi:hypothetical protein